MTTTYDSLSHSFEINEISFTGTTYKKQINNELDFHGMVLGTKRLPEERNAAYKKRLLDTYVNRANSTYTGLINGMTRELGLELSEPISFTFITTDPDDYPEIEFSESVVRVWKSVFDDEPELTINRSSPLEPEYFLSGLINTINTSSNVIAELTDSGLAFMRSDCIVNTNSTKSVVSKQIIGSKINLLEKENILIGSVSFNNLNNFKEEVLSKNLVLTKGQYYIDYANGVIHSFDIPEEGTFVQFKYREEEFIPKASPVIIRGITHPDFQQVLFNKVQISDNEYSYTTPTFKGAAIINELLSVVPMYWGE